MKTPQHIIVPTDLSAFSLSALQYAVEIAALFEAQITVVHVIDHHEERHAPSGHLTDAEWEERGRRRIAELLLERELEPHGMRIVVRHGHAPAEIVRAIRDLNGDLVVMSTHGRTGLGHVLVGSVAEKVVRFAPCPVLTVKPDEFREIVTISEDDVAGSLHLGRED